ncbi:zinc finger protein 318-like [Elgaria multicarinata webbii]|uniref:zinc finger protein 318-like n=1 Tax=Elgaria multicarinata webbii TaxID=159646 RepID=UPI002FCD4680
MEHTDGSSSAVSPSSPCKKDGSSSAVSPSSPCKKDGSSSAVTPSNPCKKDGSGSAVSPSNPCEKDGSGSAVSPSSPCKKNGRSSAVSPSSPCKKHGRSSAVTPSSPCKKHGRSSAVSPSSPCKKDSRSSVVTPSNPCKKDGRSSAVTPSNPCKKDGSGSAVSPKKDSIRSTQALPRQYKKDGSSSSGSHSSRSGASTSKRKPVTHRRRAPFPWTLPDRRQPLSKSSSRRSPSSRHSSRRCSPSQHSRSPGRRSRSPGRRSRSPGRRSRSVGRRSHSPDRRSRSPGQRSHSAGRRSRSAGRRSRSPDWRSRSPDRRSRSPDRRSRSPDRRSRSPGWRSRSPDWRSRSAGRRSRSPGRRSRSPGRRSRSPGRRSRSPGRRSRSPGRRSRSPGRHTPSRHPESSVEQSLQIIVGNDCYVIDSPERKRTPDRLCSPVDSRVDRDGLADGPIFSRSISPRSLGRYPSLEERSSSPFSVRHDADYRSRNYDHLHDQPRETDNYGELLRKSLYPSEDRGREPKQARYDRDDRLLDMSIEPHGFTPATRNYRKRSLSRSPSPTYLDEDFRKLVNARRKREEEELRNFSRKLPGSGYVTNSIQSSEPRYLHRPDDAPAMPKKSILKKRVDDPFMQNCGSFLKQKETHELTSENLDRHSDFLLPHERASQDGSGFSRILGMMTDSTSAQEKRRHSFIDDIEDEEKFLYGDDEGSNVNFLSTQKLTLSGENECMSQKVSSSLLPRPSVKPNTSEASRPDDEKIHDLLMTIGLDIGVAEISKLAARTQERLHGKKPSRSPDRHLVASCKPESRERQKSQSNTDSLESTQKCSLSPSGSFSPSKDMSFVSNSEHNTSKTVRQDNPAGTSVPLIPSAPPSLPAPTSFSWYGDPDFAPFPAIQVPQNYPPPTMPPPGYNAYGHYVTYEASGWPMYIPQTSDPALSAIHGLVKPSVPPNPTRPNLKVIKEASLGKGTPNIQRAQSVLVQIPMCAPSSNLLTQSSVQAVKETISDESPRTSQKQRIIEEREKLKAQLETQQKKLHYLRIELNRLSKQQEVMLQKKRKPIDPLLVEVIRQKENIAKKVSQLALNVGVAKKKQSELDKVAQILGINMFEKSQKLSSENKDTKNNNSKNARSQGITSNPIKVSDGAPAKGFPSVMTLTPNQNTIQDTGQPLGPNPGGMQATAARSGVQSVPGPPYTADQVAALDVDRPACGALPMVPEDGSTHQESMALSIPSNPAQKRWGPEPVKVVICGHSLVFWASHRATQAAVGTQLGLSQFASIQWVGRRHMMWGRLLDTLFHSGVVCAPPQLLVLHLGGNDMGVVKGKALIVQVQEDFKVIWSQWPDTCIIWSNILPRRQWREGGDVRCLNRAVKKVNREIRLTLKDQQGSVIFHPAILPSREELYRADGVHLSNEGNDIFLQDLQVGLRDFILGKWGEGAKA